MDKTVEKTMNALESGDDGEPTAIGSAAAAHLVDSEALTSEERQVIQDEKLAAIRSAIEKGSYDSDAILEIALNRMIERLDESDEVQ